jgi:hypothetical protein
LKIIQITAGGVVQEAALFDNPTSAAIWEALPIEGVVNRWGDEIYFDIPVEIAQVNEATTEVEVGDLGYWPPGRAFCIFWGPTPISSGNKPRAYSPVNVFGRITGDPKAFSQIEDGQKIIIEKVEI